MASDERKGLSSVKSFSMALMAEAILAEAADLARRDRGGAYNAAAFSAQSAFRLFPAARASSARAWCSLAGTRNRNRPPQASDRSAGRLVTAR